jgi:hypothetical protein
VSEEAASEKSPSTPSAVEAEATAVDAVDAADAVDAVDAKRGAEARASARISKPVVTTEPAKPEPTKAVSASSSVITDDEPTRPMDLSEAYDEPSVDTEPDEAPATFFGEGRDIASAYVAPRPLPPRARLKTLTDERVQIAESVQVALPPGQAAPAPAKKKRSATPTLRSIRPPPPSADQTQPSRPVSASEASNLASEPVTSEPPPSGGRRYAWIAPLIIVPLAAAGAGYVYMTATRDDAASATSAVASAKAAPTAIAATSAPVTASAAPTASALTEAPAATAETTTTTAPPQPATTIRRPPPSAKPHAAPPPTAKKKFTPTDL